MSTGSAPVRQEQTQGNQSAAYGPQQPLQRRLDGPNYILNYGIPNTFNKVIHAFSDALHALLLTASRQIILSNKFSPYCLNIA